MPNNEQSQGKQRHVPQKDAAAKGHDSSEAATGWLLISLGIGAAGALAVFHEASRSGHANGPSRSGLHQRIRSAQVADRACGSNSKLTSKLSASNRTGKT